MPREFEGLEHVRAAALLLAVRDEKLRERLEAASEEFWRGTFYYDKWPARLQELADRVVARILMHGPVKQTVAQMTPEDARTTAADILRFMVEAEKEADRLAANGDETG